ncbi:MAG: hypothetical protein KAS32_25440 [Candidatus Peribacteraceae bacterium]|nr:hypothetical protein [Candidatus Peribacteraceae bacterium]
MKNDVSGTISPFKSSEQCLNMPLEDKLRKLQAATEPPDELEQAISKLEGTSSSDGTEQVTGVPDPSQIESPGPVIEPLPPKPEDVVSCQWYLGETNFCDKIKKSVHCSGDTKHCIVCR